MKAGRELDALVAEKVMGWKRDEEHHIVRKPFGRHGEFISTWYVNPEGARDTPPPYSTSIAAAWEVVKKMAPLRLTLRQRMVRGEEWTADLSSAVSRRGFGEGLTAAAAICLAALKTCEVEVPAEGGIREALDNVAPGSWTFV